MTYAFLIFWVASAVLIILEHKIVRLIIYLGIFSLITSGCFLLFAAPDVAMAQVVVSAFSTIIFIVAFEKYYNLKDPHGTSPKRPILDSHLIPFCFTVLLTALFFMFIPGDAVDTTLKDQYLARFQSDVGGENAVTAIYMGYRMYDTLFEALLLLVSIVAIVHLSWHRDMFVSHGRPSDIRNSNIAGFTIRLISPLLMLVSVYLVINVHISPGGGLQGGVVVAAFFVCRYMIYDIYDIRVDKVIMLEKLLYTGIILVAVFFVFIGVEAYLPMPQTIYLVTMNILIGMKVACGFFVVFYRFIVLERR